ncbi:aldehyde dehydrogenase family protein [Paracoccus mutanolyticus]|uniref:aldehyde dehydrogenase family protein n=1 Tax=Paracoccus mutanolyticus TaxID=1499308 RepID=UPI00295004A1|nr:aldehyde dehydrogenase family protein [Paracoccus mutanolyticus]
MRSATSRATITTWATHAPSRLLAPLDIQARHSKPFLIGGERLDRPGSFQAPALFLGATNAMRSSREEIFGPCASVIRRYRADIRTRQRAAGRGL